MSKQKQEPVPDLFMEHAPRHVRRFAFEACVEFVRVRRCARQIQAVWGHYEQDSTRAFAAASLLDQELVRHVRSFAATFGTMDNLLKRLQIGYDQRGVPETQRLGHLPESEDLRKFRNFFAHFDERLSTALSEGRGIVLGSSTNMGPGPSLDLVCGQCGGQLTIGAGTPQAMFLLRLNTSTLKVVAQAGVQVDSLRLACFACAAAQECNDYLPSGTMSFDKATFKYLIDMACLGGRNRNGVIEHLRDRLRVLKWRVDPAFRKT